MEYLITARQVVGLALIVLGVAAIFAALAIYLELRSRRRALAAAETPKRRQSIGGYFHE